MELSPAKRSKGSSNNIYTSDSCFVDECNADLSHCREYHRRHRVCEQHSKAPKVVIGGLDQRFCQQCSRFHALAEFDEVKRSCRKRLDVHNQRRRKSQLESLARATGTLVSSQQATRIMSHNSPQLHQSASTMESNWVKSESPLAPFENHMPLNYYVGRHDLHLESSSSPMTTNDYRFYECEQLLATTNTNRAFSLVSSPPPLSQQTTVTMQQVGLDQYVFVQEMDIKYALCDSNGLGGIFYEDQD